MLQGFGGSISAEAATKKSAAKATATSAAWGCEETEDGLGTEFTCTSKASDKYISYYLTIMCTSEQKLSHSIVGLDSDSNAVIWEYKKKAKVRVDSKPIETWNTITRGSGQALSFSKGTKFLLTKIATAKTLGFQATDEDGLPYSARFNVKNSVPMAAKFTAMGCKTELK